MKPSTAGVGVGVKTWEDNNAQHIDLWPLHGNDQTSYVQYRHTIIHSQVMVHLNTVQQHFQCNYNTLHSYCV